MAKWREEFFEDLIKRGQARGIKKWDRDKVWSLIGEMAEKDPGNGFTKTIKKHYAKASAFKPVGVTKLLNAAEKVWPGYKAPKKRKYAKRKKEPPSSPAAEAPPPPPKDKWQPDCTACNDTGKNSQGNPCHPCVVNGRVTAQGEEEAVQPPLDLPPPPPPQTHGEQVQEAWNEFDPPPPPPPSAPDLPPPPPPPPSSVVLPPPPPPPVTVELPPPPPPPPVSVQPSSELPVQPLPNSESSAVPEPPAPPLEEPLPPPPVGKTYGDNAPTQTTLPTPKGARCCFSVRVKDIVNRNLDKAVVTSTLHRYVVQETNFGANVTDSMHLHDNWWDILVEYNTHIVKVYEALLGHEWLEDGVAKPAADFGQETRATA